MTLRHLLKGELWQRSLRHRALQHWALQSTAVILAALAVEYGVQFARSVVLTHNLDRVQFGVASAMAATLTLVDMSTGLGADRYLVQAKEGGSQAALAAAHAITIARGFLSGLLLLLLAIPASRLLHIPELAAGFACLGVIPVIRGFEHLWLAQQQRQHRFLGSSLAASCANATGLVGVIAASALTHDYRAVPIGLGLQAVALVLGSHVGAGCRYRISISPQALGRALQFGAPLMINGLALAAVAQCDRLAVGHFLGVATLGHYTVAAMTFYLPSSLLLRLLMAVAQPRLSSAWHDSPAGDFRRLYYRLNGLIAAVAGSFALGVALAGNMLLTALFGVGYAVSREFLFVYGIFVFVRFAKTSVNFAGLAMGRTRDLMLSNLSGVPMLLVACSVLPAWPSLVVVALTALLGELIGTAVACYRLRAAVDFVAFSRSFLLALSLPVVSGAWVLLSDPSVAQRLAALMVVCGLAIPVLSAVLLGPAALGGSEPRLRLAPGRSK